MNDLAWRILWYLHKNPNGASGAEIARDSGVSVNTARKELAQIREAIAAYGLALEAKTSMGYRLLMVDEEKALPFLKQAANRVKNPLFGKQTSLEYKVNYIIRRLLSARRRIPLEILCDELFYSVSSVRRDLKKIEERLLPYHLSLDLKRGYGYTISGNEWGKRLCLLAQHKLFVNLEKAYQEQEREFIALFGIEDEAIRACRYAVRDAVFQSTMLTFKTIELPVIMNYIPLILHRQAYSAELHITQEQEEAILESGIIYLKHNDSLLW